VSFGQLIALLHHGLRLALFPERRALHLADMSEIVSDVRWSTALFNCILLIGRKNVADELKC
jgi:hypothetical protein